MQSQSCNSHSMILCILYIRAIGRSNVTIIMPTHTLSFTQASIMRTFWTTPYILLTRLLLRALIQRLADLVFGV